MPTLTIRANRRSIEASLRRFTREYPPEVIDSVLVPFGRDVVQAVQRQGRRPRNRTGNMRRQFRFRTVSDRENPRVQFFSNARSPQGFPYWLAQEHGTRTGVPATRFVRRAIRQARPMLTRRLEEATRRTTQRSGL